MRAAGPVSLLVLLMLLAPRAHAAEQDGERLAEGLRTNVVRIFAERDFGEDRGYGFVVGERRGELYIATANHVVRGDPEQPGDRVKRVTIWYFHDPGMPYEARLLETREKTYDLAVLRASIPEGFKWRREALGAKESLQRRTPVWFVGRSEKWYVPTQPGYVNDVTLDRIYLDIASVLPGTSGAPLIAATGIIGMIAETEEGGVARAISIDLIQRAFVQWRLPWQLKPIPITRHPPDQINISGMWRGAEGVVYQFSQQGNSFAFTASRQETGLDARGRGTIDGRQVNITSYETNRPSTGKATGTVSADANQIDLTVNDSLLGQSKIVIFRQ